MFIFYFILNLFFYSLAYITYAYGVKTIIVFSIIFSLLGLFIWHNLYEEIVDKNVKYHLLTIFINTTIFSFLAYYSGLFTGTVFTEKIKSISSIYTDIEIKNPTLKYIINNKYKVNPSSEIRDILKEGKCKNILIGGVKVRGEISPHSFFFIDKSLERTIKCN